VDEYSHTYRPRRSRDKRYNTFYFYRTTKLRERINNQIRASEVRVISNEGVNLGVLSIKDALAQASALGLDLIEISPNTLPPIAKIAEYGKYKYEQNKKLKKAKAGAKTTETKSIQIKIGTGDNDLALKARRASEWLKGRTQNKSRIILIGTFQIYAGFILERKIDRVLHLITENYKVAEEL
jgi:translation initiation factor IF-3